MNKPKRIDTDELTALAELVDEAVTRTWNAIGADLEEAASFGGGTLKNFEAVESSINFMYAYSEEPAAGELIQEAFETFGYGVVVEFLAKKFRFY